MAELTLQTLQRSVPPALKNIFFINSGDIDVINVLNRINCIDGIKPWQLTFSLSNILIESVFNIWKGEEENKILAQKELLKHSKLNSLASLGRYFHETQIGDIEFN